MPKEKRQIDKFKDAARELECDDDEQRFKARVGRLVKAKRSQPPLEDPNDPTAT